MARTANAAVEANNRGKWAEEPGLVYFRTRASAHHLTCLELFKVSLLLLGNRDGLDFERPEHAWR